MPASSFCAACDALPKCGGCSLPKVADEGGFACATSGCEHNGQRELPLPEPEPELPPVAESERFLTAREPVTPPPDAETLKARRGDLKRAVFAWLDVQPKRRASAAAIVAWLCETNGGFAALGAAHVHELVRDVTGGAELAHVEGLVCRRPVCSACGAHAVPGGLAPTSNATLCAPCLATVKAAPAPVAEPPVWTAQPRLDACGSCGAPVTAGGGVLGGKPACKECLATNASKPKFCPHCAVTASKPHAEHGPACPLRLALTAATSAPPAVTEQASADLAAVVGEPPAWRVDVTGPARETVTVEVEGKSYWQKYAGPRTASREADWLNAQLTAGASVADKLSRFQAGVPAQ